MAKCLMLSILSLSKLVNVNYSLIPYQCGSRYWKVCCDHCNSSIIPTSLVLATLMCSFT